MVTDYFGSFTNQRQREVFSFFFSTLPAQAEGVSSKNKTYVPPGLWEKGPPAYCFGIWGRIWSKDTAECIQTGRERESIRGAGLLYFEDRS